MTVSPPFWAVAVVKQGKAHEPKINSVQNHNNRAITQMTRTVEVCGRFKKVR